jgi:hypothetical protein
MYTAGLKELGFRLSYDDLAEIMDVLYAKFFFGYPDEHKQVAEMRRRSATAAFQNVLALAGWTDDEFHKEVMKRV